MGRRPGTLASALAALAALGGAATLGGCDEQPAKSPPPPPPTASEPPVIAPSPSLPEPSAAPSPVEQPEATPGASPAAASSAAPAATPAGPRDLDAILLEIEEIEGLSPNLEDPEADYEARYERVVDLAVEAAGFGLEVLPLVHKRLLEARELPKEVGYLQRSGFLSHVFARLAASDAPDALEETAKLLGTLEPHELESACERLPRGRRDAVLAGWLGRLGSPPGPTEAELRLTLLKRYAATAKTPDPALLKTLAKDPDAKVAAAANELLAR